MEISWTWKCALLFACALPVAILSKEKPVKKLNSVQLGRIRNQLQKANKKFRNATLKLSKKFVSVIDNSSLEWGGSGTKSKRGALTSVLEDYKKALGNFQVSMDSVVTQNKKLKVEKREQVVELLERSLRTMGEDHHAFSQKLTSVKQKYASKWRKELDEFIWSARGVLPGVVDLETASVSSRNRFVDSFVKNVDTFHKLHRDRLEEVIRVFQGAKSE